MTSRRAHLEQLAGSVVLGIALLLGLVLVLSPRIATPAARIAATLGSALDRERPDDLVIPIASLKGVHTGLPVFFPEGAGESRPVAHVAAFGPSDAGPWVRLRFEPGEAAAGPWALTSYAPSRKLKAALDMAVTPEAARAFGREVAGRLETLWNEAILPEARRNLPAFLDRVDPTGDTQARVLLRAFSKSIMTELDPLLDQLATHVTDAVKRKFNLLDRVGLLVKAVSGDAKGLRRKIIPVAKEAARVWWARNQDKVLAAIGRAVAAHGDEFKDWAKSELFEAARDELVLPILATQGQRLEDEGEALLRHAAKQFVEAPKGGFRVRFASVLRTQLLNKKTALLLLRRPDEAR